MAKVLAELKASPARRYFGVGTMFVLGALTLFLALSQHFDPPAWRVLLLALGGGALYVATRMMHATRLSLHLTEEGLFDSEDYLLVRFDNIRSVERGMLVLRPSNGFVIQTRQAQARRWRPGLYWVLGRRIGIGGVTAGSQSKFMADLMNMQLAKRPRDL